MYRNLDPHKALGTHTPVTVLNLFDYPWEVSQIPVTHTEGPWKQQNNSFWREDLPQYWLVHTSRERTRPLTQNISLYINTSIKLCKIKFPVTSPKSSFRQADVTLMLWKCQISEYWTTFQIFSKPKSITFMHSWLQTRIESLETVFEFRSSQSTWHLHTSKSTQSIWLPMKGGGTTGGYHRSLVLDGTAPSGPRSFLGGTQHLVLGPFPASGPRSFMGGGSWWYLCPGSVVLVLARGLGLRVCVCVSCPNIWTGYPFSPPLPLRQDLLHVLHFHAGGLSCLILKLYECVCLSVRVYALHRLTVDCDIIPNRSESIIV